VINVVVVLMVR